MFKASQNGHLLLGSPLVLKLIILFGGLILINGLIDNESKLFKIQNRLVYKTSFNTTSVQTKEHTYIPQFYNYNSNEKDAYVNFKKSNRFKRNSIVVETNRKWEKSKNPINQSNSIKSDKNGLQQTTSKTNQTPTLFFNLQTALSNEKENKIQSPKNVTYELTNRMISTTTEKSIIKSTSNYKSSTNVGYKYHDTMRKHSQNRLNKDLVNWNGLLKLIFLLLISTLGTLGNIFVISSIMIIDSFQTQGNIYIVSLALAQLLISIIALPGSCIEIMAVIPSNPTICRIQSIITQFTLVITCLSFMFISIENVSALRSRSLINHNLFCTKFRIISLVLLSWILATLIVYIQDQYQLAPAMCQHDMNKNTIWIQYHITLIISIFLLPTLITMCCFIKCAIRIKKINAQLENNPLESPWSLVAADGELVKTNLAVYLFTFFTWLPICILAPLSAVKQVNSEWINSAWWLAWSNSSSYPFVYAFFNNNFGKTFFKLFYYCCCKSHISFEGKTTMNLRRNASTAGTNNMELRVHIIPGLNMNQRRDVDYFNLHTSSGMSSGGSSNMYKNSKYVSVGKHTRTIPASDGGLGFGGSSSHHGSSAGGFHKYNSRIDSDTGNYSGSGLLNRYASRGYSNSTSYSSHLVNDDVYDRSSFGPSPSNQKYYI